MHEWTLQQIPAQTGKLAIVTGANSGIGWHTALELARAGSHLILTARTEQKGRNAVERIKRELPNAVVRFEILDLASLKSVRAFARKVGTESRIDLLVNNAGVMRIPSRELTEDGFERQFGTNFLGPFALTMLLMPLIARSKSPRVTTVSSGAATMGLKRIRFEDLQWAKGYAPWNAYCQSKLADLLFTVELGRRSAAAGVPILSNAAHPGFAMTNLQTSGPGREMNAFEKLFASVMSQDALAGSLPTLRAATENETSSGSYYAPKNFFHLKGRPVAIPLPQQAQDKQAAQRLWAEAEKLTGTSWPLERQSKLAKKESR